MELANRAAAAYRQIGERTAVARGLVLRERTSREATPEEDVVELEEALAAVHERDEAALARTLRAELVSAYARIDELERATAVLGELDEGPPQAT